MNLTIKNSVKTFTFTEAELKEHNNRIKERAYRRAAICTVGKIGVVQCAPILEALAMLNDYANYLIEEYGLDK